MVRSPSIDSIAPTPLVYSYNNQHHIKYNLMPLPVVEILESAFHPLSSQTVAHLSCGNELQRPKSDFQIRRVSLEVVEGTGDAGLQLRRVLSRRACGRDLVEGTHGCGVFEVEQVELRFALKK